MSLNPIASRVPTLLSGRLMGGSIAQTQREMLDLQLGFASGTRLQRGSDDPRATRAIQLLQSSMDRRDQRLNAISWGEAVLGRVDTSLSSLTDLVTEARALAVGQSDDSADADSRAAQAVVVSSMIDQLFAEANAEWQGLHIFGGQNGGQRPFASFLGGVRYLGSGAGLVNDNGLGLPITLSGDEAFGAVSARVAGQVDLNPALSNGVYLEDLGGVNGEGVTGGVVELTVGANTTEVDLSGAATVGEVLDRLQAELDNIAPGSTVSTDGSRFSFTVAGPMISRLLVLQEILVQVLALKAPLLQERPPPVATRNPNCSPGLGLPTSKVCRGRWAAFGLRTAEMSKQLTFREPKPLLICRT